LKLPGLCNSDWRLVPNHTDLLENNIHVNTKTGICDWKDTAIGPFGESLGGLETMRTVSEEQKELIEVARVVG
jgi:hypothetical protein